jgi:hypothetical protein
MTKKYFITKGKKKSGPYSIEDLKTIELTPNHLIWTEGFDDWKSIIEIEDLKNYILQEPPLTPQQIASQELKKVTLKILARGPLTFVYSFSIAYIISYNALRNVRENFSTSEIRDYMFIMTIVVLISSIILSVILGWLKYNAQKKELTKLVVEKAPPEPFNILAAVQLLFGPLFLLASILLFQDPSEGPFTDFLNILLCTCVLTLGLVMTYTGIMWFRNSKVT